MSKDEHLEPCPFCGHDIHLDEKPSGMIVFNCPPESSCVGSGLYALTLDKTREEAIAAWNRRVTLE